MRHLTQHRTFRAAASILAALVIASSGSAGWAASHREAPLIALDPTADITDVYAFRSWEDPSKAVFIMNVIPSQVPASGPNFFNFDDDVVYAFNLDLDGDGAADDAVIEFRFTTVLRPPFGDLPLSYAGVDPVPGLPPAITALDGPGSEGLGLRQKYSVRVLTKQNGVLQFFSETSTATSGAPLIAVPSNVGARTMPNYPALAGQGNFHRQRGRYAHSRVRRPAQGDLRDRSRVGVRHAEFPAQSPGPDERPRTPATPSNPFGLNDFEGLNVNTIAIEVPISVLPSVIGLYASTSRPASQPLGWSRWRGWATPWSTS